MARWSGEKLLLSRSILRRTDNTKLIPLRLDGCEVPTALVNMLWIDIPNVADYEREFEQIVNAVYGQYNKPPLGSAPVYVRPDVLQMDGLTPIDSVIFEHACKIAIEQGHSTLIHGGRIVSELASQGVSEKQIMETQEVLEGRLYIELYRVLGPLHAYDFHITSYGFDQFVRSAVPDYGRLCADVGRLLVRDGHDTNHSIVHELQQPIRIVDHILETFEHNGLVKSSQTMDGTIGVYWVSPELRRKLET
jgi:hypothetical protein